MLGLARLASWLGIQESQPRSGFLQVSSSKPLGTPARHLGHELPRCGHLALAVPQPTQAHGGAQF